MSETATLPIENVRIRPYLAAVVGANSTPAAGLAHGAVFACLMIGLLTGHSQIVLVPGAILVLAIMVLQLSSRPTAPAVVAEIDEAAPDHGPGQGDTQVPLSAETQLQQNLSSALAHGELRLVYQPLARLSSGKTIGYEALLRWDHPDQGLILPTRFIEAAERSGQIVPVGAWVMAEACREAARWENSLFVSVNVSAVQITSPGFADMVRAALADSGLSPARLEIEVTETAVLESRGVAAATLGALRDMGIRVALDDFGMGHASLAYLLTFPFDKIKIDRQFISEIALRPENRTIVEAVACMAHKLGIEVLAEGIEDVDQLIIAKQAGCELGQGLLLGEPRPANEHYRLRTTRPVEAPRLMAVAA